MILATRLKHAWGSCSPESDCVGWYHTVLNQGGFWAEGTICGQSGAIRVPVWIVSVLKEQVVHGRALGYNRVRFTLGRE
jgi:proteasome lid subunit RPN8/RPN11